MPIRPGGGCLLLFYESPLRPSGVAAAEAMPATAEDGGAVLLPETAIPQDLRTALHGAARMVRAAFPHAVSEIELGAPAESEDDPRHLPATPKRGSAADAARLPPTTEPDSPGAPATPLQLVIESPRAG